MGGCKKATMWAGLGVEEGFTVIKCLTPTAIDSPPLPLRQVAEPGRL